MSKFEIKPDYHYYEEAIYGELEYGGFSFKQLKQYGYVVRCLHLGYKELINYIHYSKRDDLNDLLPVYKEAVDASIKAFFENIVNLGEGRRIFRDKFMDSNDAQFVKECSSLLNKVQKYTKMNGWNTVDMTEEETVKITFSGIESFMGSVGFFGHWIDYINTSIIEAGDPDDGMDVEVLVDFNNKLEVLHTAMNERLNLKK